MFWLDLEYNPSCATQLPQLIYPVLYFCVLISSSSAWRLLQFQENGVLDQDLFPGVSVFCVCVCVSQQLSACQAIDRVFHIRGNVCYQQYTLGFSECVLITPLTYYRFGPLIPPPVFFWQVTDFTCQEKTLNFKVWLERSWGWKKWKKVTII